jgi:3-oxoadipate enol-lactonase
MPARLNHRLEGPPDAPPLVLTGSLGTDLSMWDPQVGPLSERFRLLRYDLRGHGRSEVPPGPYSIADLGGDLLALMDELGIERAPLCGLSIGGMISMWVAARAPERVERLVVFCTSAYLGSAYAERAAAVRERGIEPIADAVIERWFTPGFDPDTVARFRRMLVAIPTEGYAGCCEAIAGMDLRGDLGSIRAPTQVIAGADDPATPPHHGQAIAEGIAEAELTVIPAAAHLATVEQPARATELILRGAQWSSS